MVNASATRDRIADLLAPVLASDGLDLDAVELASAGRRSVVRVVVDADGGVNLDRIADASRQLGKVLDDADFMGSGSYTLEVTSRGVDRPLTQPRHWHRNAGRLVKVTTVDGAKLVGRIVGSDDTGADLEVEGETDAQRVAYDQVAKARIQVEFSKHTDDETDELDDLDEADTVDLDEEA
ncbi:ribosome maturation factor RimP [Flindersiella endophytica]